MTHELEQIRDVMAEVVRLEGELEAARERRTQLATRLYMSNGPTRTYMMVDQEGVRELIISRTKPRRDGTTSYFFAEKGRWRGGRVAVDLETTPLGRRGGMTNECAAMALTGRIIEATAALTGRSAAGDEPVVVTEDDFKARRVTGQHAGRLLSELCSVCGELQYSTPSGVSCPNGHGGAPAASSDAILQRVMYAKEGFGHEPEGLTHPVQPLPGDTFDNELALPSQAEIEAAAEQGRRDSAATRASRGGLRLPIVGEGRPEPRLLQITEEVDDTLRRGLALTAEQLGQDEVDPDQAILDELLSDM